MKKTVLFALVLVLLMIVVNLSAMKVEGYFQEEGYIISNQDLDHLITEQESTVLTPIALMDELLSRFDGFFCNQGKTKLNTTYPQYIQDGLSLRFFNDDATLIANDFYSLPTYDHLYLSNGNTYNSDRSRADLEEFIFVKIANDIYYFAQNASVETVYEQHNIPTNSIAILTKDAIQYLAFNQGKLEPHEVTALNSATITIGDNQYDYYSLYTVLQGISTNVNEEGYEPEATILPVVQPEVTPTPSSTPTVITTPVSSMTPNTPSANVPTEAPSVKPTVPPTIAPSQSPESGKPGQGHPNPFVPPKVSISSTLKPWVYNVTGSLEIEDQASSLYRGVQVYIYYANTERLYMRKTIRTTGEFTIGTLIPNTEFDLSVSFKYRTPKKEKYDVVVTDVPIRFKTLSRDELVPIVFNLEGTNGSDHIYYPNQVKIDNIEFSNLKDVVDEADIDESLNNNSTEQQTVNYISKIQSSFRIVDTTQTQTINLPAGVIKRIKDKESVDWLTTPVLDSNTEYEYDLKLYDAFNVELPLDQSSISNGKTKTSKTLPLAKMNLLKNSVGHVQFNLTVENPDKAEIKGIYMELKNTETQAPVLMQGIVNGEVVTGYQLDLLDDLNQVVLKNLPSSQVFDLYVHSVSYDTGDNQLHENVVMLKQSFYTESMLTLGKAYYTTKYENVKATSADILIKTGTRINELLKIFIDEIDVSVVHRYDNSGYNYKLLKKDLDVFIELDELTYVNEFYEYVVEDNDKFRILIIGKDEHDLINPWEAILFSSELDNTIYLKMEFKNGSLKSNSLYDLKINTMASQGGTNENVTAITTYDDIVTLKMDAKVKIENQFTASNFHEIYNYQITDADEVVIGDKLVVMRLYDGQTMISTKTLDVNKNYSIHRFANLQENKQYHIEFLAVEYNNTSDPRYNLTYKQIGKYEFTTGESVVSELSIANTELSYADNFESLNESNLARKAIENGQITRGHFMSVAELVENENTSVIKFEVTPGDKYVVMNFAPYKQSGLFVVFHDEKNAYINRFTTGMPTSLESMSSAVFSVPNKTKYMYINVDDYYLNTITVMKYNEDFIKDAPNILKFDNSEISRLLLPYGAIVNNVGHDTTDYLEIQGSQFYQANVKSGRLAFYDSNKRFISFTYLGNYPGVYQAPSTAKYMKVTYSKTADKSNFSLKMYRPVDINRINANFKVKLIDKKQELVVSPKYSIKLYRTELVNELKESAYELYDKYDYDIQIVDGKTQDVDTSRVVHNIPRNYAYKAVISVELYGSEIQLDTAYFNTASRVESIYEKNDFAKIIFDPTANYMVYEDIETNHVLLGENVRISGVLDFDGHSISSHNVTAGLFSSVGPTGVVKNAVVNS